MATYINRTINAIKLQKESELAAEFKIKKRVLVFREGDASVSLMSSGSAIRKSLSEMQSRVRRTGTAKFLRAAERSRVSAQQRRILYQVVHAQNLDRRRI